MRCLTVLCLALLVTPAAAQRSDKLAFCNDYADESVELQKRNLTYRCGFTGLRWHEWWDGHYGWCKDWVSETQVDEERELRRIQIAKCHGDDRGGGRRSERDYDRR